jgi:hypothetical protein
MKLTCRPSCAWHVELDKVKLQGQELNLISKVQRRGALSDNFQVADSASYFQVVRNDDDAGHWQSLLHSFTGMPGAGINVVSEYDPTLARGPVKQNGIAATPHAGLLHDEVIKLRQTQSQASKNALVKVFVDEETKHG